MSCSGLHYPQHSINKQQPGTTKILRVPRSMTARALSTRRDHTCPTPGRNNFLYRNPNVAVQATQKPAMYYDDLDDRLAFADILTGKVYDGCVDHIVDYGAFVDISAEVPCLVHVSELSPSYVTHPKDVVDIGMPVSVKIINKDCDREVLGGTFIHPGMRVLQPPDQEEA